MSEQICKNCNRLNKPSRLTCEYCGHDELLWADEDEKWASDDNYSIEELRGMDEGDMANYEPEIEVQDDD